MNKLAVIIPFYKASYFKELMLALEGQTVRAFTIYIGNDASDPEVKNLVQDFSEGLEVRYHRFNDNLGRRDLAAQWNRCAGLSDTEEWLWFVPDDDIPSANCVEEILTAVERADEVAANVIHLPSIIGDAKLEGIERDRNMPAPQVMPAVHHYLAYLRNEIKGSTLASSVYRRSAFLSVGGFVSFPKGWGSDHATPLLVANGGNIVSVRSAFIGFRMSGENISSKLDDALEKMKARIEFARFMKLNLPLWCEQETAEEIISRIYMRSEFYATRVWPFSWRLAALLFEHAEGCGTPRSFSQKLTISARGWMNTLRLWRPN